MNYNLSDEILKAVQIALDKQKLNYDQTFKSVITDITDKGYTIRDTSGVTREVKCCIPGVSLKIGQSVWVTVPCGKIGEMFVCGVG